MGLFNLFKKGNKEGSQKKEPYHVEITDTLLNVTYPSGEDKVIEWDQIDEILILVTTDGPELPDVWLTLRGRGKNVMLPLIAPGYEKVYDIVSKYDGFDFEAVIQAMSTVPDRDYQFTLWKKEEGQSPRNLQDSHDDGEVGKWGFVITVNDDYIKIEHPERKTEMIKWNAIEHIAMMKTDGRGVLPSIWLILAGKGSGCVLPEGVHGFKTVMRIVSDYEGFSVENVVLAMNKTDDEPVPLWNRNADSPSAPPINKS